MNKYNKSNLLYLFIDKSRRIDLFCIVMFIIQTILSFQIKGRVLGSVDLINCFVSLFLGLLFGRTFLLSRLNTFEMKRLLILEKETDFLTSLQNRRKLYKDYKEITKKGQSLVGVLMIDIDNFKQYNDKFGSFPWYFAFILNTVLYCIPFFISLTLYLYFKVKGRKISNLL